MDAQDFLATARRFREERVRPSALQWEQDETQPVSLLKEAAQAGLFRLETPVSEGGYALPFTTKLEFCEEMSRADMPFTFSLINTQNMAARLAYLGEAFAEYVPQLLDGELFGATALSEPGMGSDFSAIQTKAKRVEGGWRLTGEKAWITNAQIADLFAVYAQTKEAGDPSGIAGFVVDARSCGFSRSPAYDVIGGHAIGVGGFRMEDVFVPDDHVLSVGGDGFKYALRGVNTARVYVAAMCVGIVADALDRAVQYGVEREAFSKPVIEHQGLRWKLSDVSTELAAMRALTYEAGRAIENGEPAVLLAAQAKKFASERSVFLIETCIQAMGANGLRKEAGLGRHLIAAKIAGYTDGSIEMMNERVGASLVKAARSVAS